MDSGSEEEFVVGPGGDRELWESTGCGKGRGGVLGEWGYSGGGLDWVAMSGGDRGWVSEFLGGGVS